MKLSQKSMCFKAAIEQRDYSTNTGITTHHHSAEPRGGVKGVIPTKQGY